MSADLRYVSIEQRTPAWHNWRQSRRMASETPALLGLSKYGLRTPLDLWRLKVLGERPAPDGHAERAQAHGEAYEAEALALLNAVHQLKLEPACFERGEYAASFDGIEWELGAPHATVIAEIKCPYAGVRSSRWRLAERGELRDDDMAQVQHQLMVSGAPHAIFAVYVPGVELRRVRVPALPEWHARISAAWDDFWPRVESMTPPDDTGPVERDDALWAEAVQMYRDAKAAEERAAKALKFAEEQLRAIAGTSSARGAGLTLTRYWANGNVDYSRIPQLSGVDLDKFRKPGAWRTRINIEKETK